MAEYQLLGPVQMLKEGRPVDLGPPQRRTVIAALLVDAGRLVTTERLIERVWGDRSPQHARTSLYSHIARIRGLVGAKSVRDRRGAEGLCTSGPVLSRRPGGYLLDVPTDRIDLHRYRLMVERAGAPGRTDHERVALLREALHRWHGEPLAGLPGTWAARTRETWRQQHVDTVMAWGRAELSVGNPTPVITVLPDLVAEHPLAEQLTAVLMRALHVTGRSAEALSWFEALRRRLADALGTDPGGELRRLHQAILRDEPDACAPMPEPVTAGAAARRGPAQLPPCVSRFTGRAAELTGLFGHLGGRRTGSEPSAVLISGTPGVGKTALAVRWAHQARAAYPDGQLYVNLRGYDTRPPVAPTEALAGLLSALGVPGQEMPPAEDDRAARYRSELSGRSMLIVLDNASSVEQVRPLLPGTPNCAVIVTSRDSLPGLVAVHGAHRLVLDLLPEPDAIALLRALIGSRVDAEPRAAAALTQFCARLPLALRVAAELALNRPDTPLSDLVPELADHRRRLDLLDAGGDPRAAVRAVFFWSYRGLPSEAARVFRLLGTHPGPDFDVRAAAALADADTSRTAHVLEALARAHLIQRTGSGRYCMHELLRAYARWLADHEDGEAAQGSARTRMFDHYLTGAAAAVDALYPAERHRRPAVSCYRGHLPPSRDETAARDWLDRERLVLLSVARHARDNGSPGVTDRLAAILYSYLCDGGHVTESLVIHSDVLAGAREMKDEAAEAGALTDLGVVHR
ncbi:AfsR/SARP family transcriptional regulator [Streptomyces cadmiisoli]|uniref:AfsR/SARP family transcriptional regulator n=1 Tax=Streptomyces cadmiisoli TaxID=2184053 RepID=UPI003D755B2D